MIYDQLTILDNHFDKRLRDTVHTSFPAEITKVVNSGVVNVKPLVATLRPDGKAFAYSELYNVRIMSYACHNGDIGISLPVRVGDKVWVMVSERDTYPLMSLDRVEASSSITHDLSDCFCIPQFFTDSKIPTYSTEHLVIKNNNTEIIVKADEVVVNTPNVVINADITVNGEMSVNGDTKFNANVDVSGNIKNQGVNIGKDHKHTLVQSGTSDSGSVKP